MWELRLGSPAGPCCKVLWAGPRAGQVLVSGVPSRRTQMSSNPRTLKDPVSGHDATLPVGLKRRLQAWNYGSQVYTYLGLLLKRLGFKYHPITHTCPATPEITGQLGPGSGGCPRLGEEVSPGCRPLCPGKGQSEQCHIPGPSQGGSGRCSPGEGGFSGRPEDRARLGLAAGTQYSGRSLVAEKRHWLVAPSWRLAQSGGSRDLLGVWISDTCQHWGPGQVSYPLCASVYHLQNRGEAAAGREKVCKDRPRGSLEATPGDLGAWTARSGQTAASPGVHLPAQGLACPTCPVTVVLMIILNNIIVLGHVKTTGRSEGGTAAWLMPGASLQVVKVKPAGGRWRLWGGAQGDEAQCLGPVEVPPLPSPLTIERDRRAAAAEPGCPVEGRAPGMGTHTHTNQPPPAQPPFPGLPPRPRALGVLSLSIHLLQGAWQVLGRACCFPQSCGTLGKLVNLSVPGFFSVNNGSAVSPRVGWMGLNGHRRCSA